MQYVCTGTLADDGFRSDCLRIVYSSLSRYPYHRCHYLPSAHYVVCTFHAYATQVTKLYSYGSEWSPWTTFFFRVLPEDVTGTATNRSILVLSETENIYIAA